MAKRLPNVLDTHRPKVDEYNLALFILFFPFPFQCTPPPTSTFSSSSRFLFSLNLTSFFFLLFFHFCLHSSFYCYSFCFATFAINFPLRSLHCNRKWISQYFMCEYPFNENSQQACRQQQQQRRESERSEMKRRRRRRKIKGKREKALIAE